MRRQRGLSGINLGAALAKLDCQLQLPVFPLTKILPAGVVAIR
jgi:hypothetical protein